MEIPISKSIRDKVIIRHGPRRSTTQVHALIEENSDAHKLCQTAKARDAELGNNHDYYRDVFAYLQIYAAYTNRGKLKPLITDIEQIHTGMKIAKTLNPVGDIRILRIRDTNYDGSFDAMLEDFENNRLTRPAYRMADRSGAERERIQELKTIQEKKNLNLADYCLVL